LRDVRRYGGSPDLKSWLHRVRDLRRRRLADDEELLDDRALDRVTQENEGPADCIVWQFGNSQTLHSASTLTYVLVRRGMDELTSTLLANTATIEAPDGAERVNAQRERQAGAGRMGATERHQHRGGDSPNER